MGIPFTFSAACGSNIGKIRENNEDNFYFDRQYMDVINRGLASPLVIRRRFWPRQCLAVFDGIGGASFGEVASYTAANAMHAFLSVDGRTHSSSKEMLLALCDAMNQAVVDKTKELSAFHMGTTLVGLYFSAMKVLFFNLGDSRAFCLRNGKLLQMSKDHVDLENKRYKAPLTQYIGIDPEELRIQPFVVEYFPCPGDRYLLCSDGLTDMVEEGEIKRIMLDASSPEAAVSRLIESALDNGGKDNVTVIICSLA